MKSKTWNNKGTSVVEMAIVLPLLLLLVFGIIEFSLALYDKAMITNASREGARAGIVFRAAPGGAYNPVTEPEIKAVVDGYLGTYLISFDLGDAASTAVSSICSEAEGESITVTVKYTYTFLIFPNIAQLIAQSIMGPINMTAATTMRCE